MRIAVVGAGILGASTAYHLAAAGAEVGLVDDVSEGRATAAGAGIICPWPSLIEDPAWYMLASAGARYYPRLIALLAEAGQTDVSYRKTGAMIVAGEAELDQVERRVRGRAPTTPEVGAIARLTPREAQALFPPLRKDRAALHIEGGARVDGAALARAMSHAAVADNAKLMRGRAELSTLEEIGESEWRRVLGRTVRRHFGDSRPLWGGLESGDESPVRRNPGHPKAIYGYVVGSRRTRTATFRGG